MNTVERTKRAKHRRRGIIAVVLWAGAVIVLGLALTFDAYTVVVQEEGDAPLPPLFGNFPSNRARLENVREKGEFAFAVVGDTKSVGTFERIIAELRTTPLDFAVLLGDCSYDGTEEHHRYFRAECAEEYALPFPVFYVVGNHDVSQDGFPISRFEEVYGPSIFSFEHRQCLFIVLRILNAPFTNEDSLEFLTEFRKTDLSKYLHSFVFLHIPPPVSPTFSARPFGEAEQLVKLLDELGIEYVFAGDFHGYAQARLRKTTYIVTGGGGAHLAKKPSAQFHHALVLRVTPDSVDKRIVFVPRTNDREDRLEKLAITEVWPWMQRHPYLAIALNAAGVCAFIVVLARPLISRRRRGKSGKGLRFSKLVPPGAAGSGVRGK